MPKTNCFPAISIRATDRHFEKRSGPHKAVVLIVVEVFRQKAQLVGQVFGIAHALLCCTTALSKARKLSPGSNPTSCAMSRLCRVSCLAHSYTLMPLLLKGFAEHEFCLRE
jgi:hypothetical protein